MICLNFRFLQKRDDYILAFPYEAALIGISFFRGFSVRGFIQGQSQPGFLQRVQGRSTDLQWGGGRAGAEAVAAVIPTRNAPQAKEKHLSTFSNAYLLCSFLLATPWLPWELFSSLHGLGNSRNKHALSQFARIQV